jgi:hypothetical protein
MVKVVQYKGSKLLFRRRSSSVNRRRLDNRRRVYSLDYFSQGGIERRKALDRRKRNHDRRKGWVKISDGSSVYIDPDPNQDSA